MKRNVLTTIFFFLALVLYGQEAKITDDLSLEWETKGFDTPESIFLNSSKDVLYISNIGGNNPTQKDGNGFISTIKPSGEIIDINWIGGLNAPKGMAMSKGFLYVTDIDRVVKIDVDNAEIAFEINIDGAQFLNDIVTLNNGDLLVSDSKANNYILISGREHKLILQDSSFKFPNGITLHNDMVYTGIGDRIVKINPETWEISDYILQSGGVDGIAQVIDDTFVISDWQGRVHLISPESKKLILNTTELESVNAADFCFDKTSKKLYIPTFFNNSVACYLLK